MKYWSTILIVSSIVLTSCRQSRVEEVEIIEPGDSEYSLCDAEQAQFSLLVDFDVKGVTKNREVYHFPRVMSEDEFFMPTLLMCSADGGGGGFNLSYGVWGASSTGITFRVSCSYTVDDKRGKVEKNLTTPWFEAKNEDTDELSISLQWIKREPNKTSGG